jgi:type I restriction enzyme S subunit
MIDWKPCHLSDIITIKHGWAFKGEFFSEEPTDDILLTPGNFLIGGGFKSGKFKYYNGEVPSSYILNPGDIIVTMTDLSKQADTLGFSAKVPNDKNKRYLHNQRIGLVGLKNNDFDLEYIYWLLRTESYQKFVAGSATGATVKHTSPTKIYYYKFFAPKLKSTQKRIASILSAYDDLIENNSKRIKLLEEIAQRTYEEWFVKFRVNGEQLPMDEATGLPVGWERKKISAICEKITDGTHDSPKQTDSGFKLITGKHLLNGGIDFESAYNISEEDHIKITKRSGLKINDILFSNIGTLGNVAIINDEPNYSCKNMIIFRPSFGMQFYLYSYLTNKNNKERFLGQSSGSTQKFISLNYIRSFEDNMPDNNLILKFNDVVKSFYSTICNLQKQNEKLKQSCDILLPRLMSGTINVV